jgi:sirohydrochlorin ferrochelatase
MRSLLIIAHGSRRTEANEEIRYLAQSISGDPENVFDHVTHAFLEIAEPAVEAAIASLVESGSAEILIFPYFLAGGTHVANDVPRMINDARAKHTHVKFEILPYLGAIEGLSTLIVRQINRSDS